MTSDTTAIRSSHGRLVANQALTPVLAVMIIAAATISGAWFFQLVLDIQPCPLCLEQRYAYYLIVPLAALLAFGAARGAPRPLLVAGLVVIALAALGNSVLGTYHAGVEWKLWAGPTDCTGQIGNFGSASNLLQRLGTVKVVPCDVVQWHFLGLSLAGYNALISVLMAAVAAFGAIRSARS